MQDLEKLTFEQAFQQLEEAIQALEAGDLPLEESLKAYERGMLLARYCENKLDTAEQKASQVTGIGDDQPTLTPFSPED